MSDPINLPLLRERLALAHGMVSDLCKRQGEPGWRRWEMSIPANPSRDPDLVIAAGLDAGDALAAEVDRLTARVAELEQARARDVAGIVGWMRTYPAVERSPGTVGCMTLAEAADAIERGDWRDAPLPPDPRDAERLNLLDYAGGLENTIENMLWNLGGVSSVCMGALDADFTFDESAARAALHDAVKLRREFLALRAAARGVLSLTGDETEGEQGAALGALAEGVGDVG